MLGGFEVDWNQEGKVWEPHVHLVAFVREKAELEPLRRHFREGHGVSRPMQVQVVRRLHRAIPYCVKYAPMRKVRYEQAGSSHTRKMRLCAENLRNALMWLDENRPPAFLFLVGLKLQGSKLVET